MVRRHACGSFPGCVGPVEVVDERRESVDKSVSTALALSANLAMRPAGFAPGPVDRN